MKSAPAETVAALLLGTGDSVCAIPLDRVVETMRPLAIEPLQGCPDFVAGLAVIRGEPVPVVPLAVLTGAQGARSRRFVTLRVDGQTGGRVVALAVERVIGVRRLDLAGLAKAPPLLDGMRPDLISHLGTLDGALLMVLETGRLLPDGLPSSGSSPRLDPSAGDGGRS